MSFLSWESNIIKKREEELPSSKIFYKDNKVLISGRIEAELEYSHGEFIDEFYQSRVIVERESGTCDFIPFIVSDILIGKERMKSSLAGKWV